MTATTAAPKKTRTARVEMCLGRRLLILTAGTGPAAATLSYHLAECRADFGRTFVLRKFEDDGGERYEVVIGGTPGNGDSCTCPDARYRPRAGGCKHVAALKALILNGRL